MQYEVEQKFPVLDFAAIEHALGELDARFDAAAMQVDRYFAHPVRNFAATDEALRIRRVGDENFITYKGPKLDSATKTRREIELPLPGGPKSLAEFTDLLSVLGFSIVAEVRKRRRSAAFSWEGRTFEAALDEVDSVGKFVELEILADASELDAARGALASLAARLGLSTSERRSYLELLLAAQKNSTTDVTDKHG